MRVRKMFLKPLALFMTVCMMVGMYGTVSAETVFDYGDKQIVVYGEIDAQKAQLIAATINGEIVISPFNNCSHTLAQTMAAETTHRVWAAAPRCRRVTYLVTYCTKSTCTYITRVVIGDERIHCCP